MHRIFIAVLLTLFSAVCIGQDGMKAGMANHPSGAKSEKGATKHPRVPFKFAVGMKKFRTMCGKCHGEWGHGTDKGPPLMHVVYKPSHHGDGSYYQAALKGVKAHHWKFGDMPPVPDATSDDVSRILPFIRWLQQENGVY